MSGTSNPGASPAAPGRGHREVLGLFRDREHLEAAAYRLQSAGFNRANLSLAYDVDLDGVPDPGPREEVSTESDVRKLRTLKTGLAGAVAALAAAGVTVMTGGTAAIAFGAAALAAGASAAGVHGLGGPDGANGDRAILIARATRPELEATATEILRAGGADKVWAQDAA